MVNEQFQCPKCNRTIFEEYAACPYCGWDIYKCKKCKRVIPSLDTQFCPHCGASQIEVPEQTQSVASVSRPEKYKSHGPRSEFGGCCTMICLGALGYYLGSSTNVGVGILLMILFGIGGFAIGYYGNLVCTQILDISVGNSPSGKGSLPRFPS